MNNLNESRNEIFNIRSILSNIIFSPICILLIIIIILAFITAINGLFINNDGGASLGGGIALFFLLIFVGIFLLEQSIIKALKAPLKGIWIIESISVLVLILIIYLGNVDLSVG